mgnify:CR=1 FL=1
MKLKEKSHFSIVLELFYQAHLAKEKAYCPYSKFRYEHDIVIEVIFQSSHILLE